MHVAVDAYGNAYGARPTVINVDVNITFVR